MALEAESTECLHGASFALFAAWLDGPHDRRRLTDQLPQQIGMVHTATNWSDKYATYIGCEQGDVSIYPPAPLVGATRLRRIMCNPVSNVIN